MTRHSTPPSKFLRIGAAILIAAIVHAAPGAASATVVTSAANIPYSGISPGGVNLATGEYCVQYRESDLLIGGPIPLGFNRYYASMLAREGFASGHLGPNWLGTYDWSLSVSGPIVNVVTNRGQQIQFHQNALGGYDLVRPMDQKYRLEMLGPMWRLTHPSKRRIFLFDGASRLLTQILDEHGNSLSLFYGAGLLSQVTDGLGRTLMFSYDPLGHVSMVTDGTRSVSYSYTGGFLTGVTDAAGHITTYGYAVPAAFPGLLASVTEPMGNTPVTCSYDALGRVSMQTDALGSMAMYSYDAPSGNVYTDPLGNAWTYRHDPYKLTALIDPATGTTSFTYDALGRPSMITRPLGDATSFAYDAASGYPSSITLGDGSVFSFTYSSHSVSGATFFSLFSMNDPIGATESYGRDAAGNLTDFTDRGGFHWLGTYNPRGQMLTATNPSGGVTTFTYDPQGRPETGRDNAGNTTSYMYDPLSRLTQITWPDGNRWSFAYDVFVHVTGLTDERGKLWSYAYDDNGRLIRATDPLLEGTGLVYDALDRVTQVVDPLGHARVYAYDPAGRLMSMTDRSGRTTSYQYDAVGRLATMTDAAGGTNSVSYDADSRLTSATDPMGHVTLIGSDFMDRTTHVTDPVGTGFDYTYDSMGRLRSASGPLSLSETYSYDPRGLLTSRFKGFTVQIDFARTPLGEVSQLTDPNRNLWPAAYDPQGRPTSSADPLGRTTSFTYDARSRVTHAALPLGSVNFTYDPAGRLTDCQWLDGTTLTYSYDDANRLIGATGAAFAYDAAERMTSSNGLTMAYDNEGRITSETYAPGKVVSYSYNSRGLLTEVIDWVGGATTFSYDAAWRLTGITRPNGTSATFQYDNADRLVQAIEGQPGPISTPLATIALTRDALGQPTSIARRQPLMPGATSPATTAFTYDAASQISGFSWDPLGRLVSDGTRTFEWDAASRLKHYAAGADSPRFTYNAFELNAQQSGNAQEQYVWNYAHGRPTLDAIYRGATPSRYYVYTPAGLLLDCVDATSGARSFYHYDEAGNTIFLTNDAGSVTTEYAYTPNGGVSALGQTTGNPFTYGAAAGMIQLGSSGLYSKYGSTIFDAQTMRVISGMALRSGAGGDMRNRAGHPNADDTALDLLTYGRIPIHTPEAGRLGIHYDDPASDGWYSADVLTPLAIWDIADPGKPPPGSWVTVNPGPIQTPGSWVTANPGPIQTDRLDPYKNFATQPGPSQSPGGTLMQQGRVITDMQQGRLITDNFGVENPTTIGSATSGAGGGKTKFNEFTISKYIDKASPAFFKNCVAGAHYKKVVLEMRKAGGDPSTAGRPFLRYRFDTVFTTKIDWSGPGDEGPEESITFQYGKLGISYIPQDGGPSSSCTWCVR